MCKRNKCATLGCFMCKAYKTKNYLNKLFFVDLKSTKQALESTKMVKTKKTEKKQDKVKTSNSNKVAMVPKAELLSMTESLQRLQAEFENYKKRTEKERIEFAKFAEEDLMKSMLPVLDSFELALQNKTSPQEFQKGVELIFAQLFQQLEEKGLKPIKSKGEAFDPYKHEALLTEESKEKPNTVLEELQKGYTFNDKVIRHTKVKVSK